jgi:hypothetical protein
MKIKRKIFKIRYILPLYFYKLISTFFFSSVKNIFFFYLFYKKFKKTKTNLNCSRHKFLLSDFFKKFGLFFKYSEIKIYTKDENERSKNKFRFFFILTRAELENYY